MQYNTMIQKKMMLGALSLVSASVWSQQRPNVIFIMADDLGYGDLECYQGKEKTPHINAFASEGCQFMDAYAVASTSTPSRYSFLPEDILGVRTIRALLREMPE